MVISIRLFWILYSLTIIVFVFIQYTFNTFVFDKSLLISTIILSIFSLIFFVLSSDSVVSVRGIILRPISLLIFGYLVVHFQKYIDYLLGFIVENDFNRITSLNAINKAALVSLIGITMLLCGYKCFIRSKVFDFVRNDLYSKLPIYPLVISGFLIIAYLLYYYRDYYLQSQYGSNTDGGRAAIEQIYKIIVCAIFVIQGRKLAIKNIKISFWTYVKSYGILFNISFLSFIALILISGDRGPAITSVMAYLFSYILVFKSKMNLMRILIFIFIGSFLVSTLGVARSLDKNIDFFDRFILSLSSENSYTDVSISPFTVELASSGKTLEYAVYYFPEKHPYYNGQMMLNSIFKLPGRRTVLPVERRDQSSAAFFTWIEKGDFPNSGIGSNMVADIFLDFGILGVIFFMFLFGWGLRMLDIYLFSDRIDRIPVISHVMGLIIFMQSLSILRGSLFANLRVGIWCFVLLFLYKTFLLGYGKSISR